MYVKLTPIHIIYYQFILRKIHINNPLIAIKKWNLKMNIYSNMNINDQTVYKSILGGISLRLKY